MLLMLAIGIPLFLVLGGGLLGFASRPPRKRQPAQPAARPSGPALVFFEPVGWSSRSQEATVEEIVASLEKHLRESRELGSTFARDPKSKLD